MQYLKYHVIGFLTFPEALKLNLWNFIRFWNVFHHAFG